MATVRRRRTGADAPKNLRVFKRKPRIGPKRAKNLVMLDDLVVKLEAAAARARTTPAELVQDWIELHCKRGADSAGAEPAAGGVTAAA